MRARGTRVTDIAVLVVAADDGVMQTTREAIQHVRDANCSLIVALTKCDRDGARPEAVEGELMAEGLELESAGGNVQVVHVAAPKGIGLRELEEAILLQAEMLGVSAPVDSLPEASVVESHVNRGQGPVITVVMKQGVLKVGQPVVVGKEHGRVRSLHDPEGTPIHEATPGVQFTINRMSICCRSSQVASPQRACLLIAYISHITRTPYQNLYT
jgi:translation initiation factor IF-2